MNDGAKVAIVLALTFAVIIVNGLCLYMFLRNMKKLESARRGHIPGVDDDEA